MREPAREQIPESRIQKRQDRLYIIGTVTAITFIILTIAGIFSRDEPVQTANRTGETTRMLTVR